VSKQKRIKARTSLSARSPSEWRKLINSIEDYAVKVQVACIVWWDYFGGRTTAERWANLDDLVAAWSKDMRPDLSAIESELLRMGYYRDNVKRKISILKAT
jgi:hypothetical protein